MSTKGIIALIAVMVILVIFLYSCFVAASDADDQMEREAIKRACERNCRRELPSDTDR